MIDIYDLLFTIYYLFDYFYIQLFACQTGTKLREAIMIDIYDLLFTIYYLFDYFFIQLFACQTGNDL